MSRSLLLYLYLFSLLYPLVLSSSQGLFLPARVLDDEDSSVDTSSYPEDDYKFDNITAELEYINLLMVGINIIGGDWQSLTNSSLRNMTGSQGLALLSYYIGESFDANEIKSAFQFDLNLFDGDFIDQSSIRVSFYQYIPWITNDNYSSVDSTLSLQNATVYLTTPNSFNNVQSEKCFANINITFVNTTTNGSFIATGELDADQIALGLQFSVESDSCMLYFNTSILSVGEAIDETPATIYTICMSVAALIQCIVCQYLTTGLEEGNINVRKISLGTLRLLNAFDFYLCLINLGRFMDHSLVVGFTAVPFAVLSLHFEFKLIVVVVTLQSRLAAMDVSKLNLSNVFWLFMSMAAVVISGVYGKPIFIYFAFAMSQVPQIIQNFVLQQRHRWHCCLLLPLTLPKIGYLAYMLTSNENIFMTTPNPALFVVIVIAIISQLVLLLVQTRRSTLCQKEEIFYKFYDASDKECAVGQDVCCICLEKLNTNPLQPQETQDGKDTKDSKEVSFLSASTEVSTASSNQKHTIVSPPCNHTFHENCLKEWIKQKHECPYCRCALPYMPGEDDE